MLTKDLLCHKIKRNGSILPQLLNPETPVYQEIAERMIGVFQEHVGNIRKNLETSSKAVIDAASCEGIVVRGFEKLLLDRSDFDTGIDSQQIKLRESIFLSATQILKGEFEKDEDGTELLHAYHQKITEEWDEAAPSLSQKLYQDLPAYQKILAFKPINSEALIHRYNCAQVQGLLIYSSQIHLNLEHTEPALMRQLLKYLRFHQLLAETKTSANGYEIRIDGPLNLFQQSRKYGLQLANFFPAILNQSKWTLKAEIQIRKRSTHHLEINQDCGIRSHYQHFNAYVPESFSLLQHSINKNLPEWNLETADDFLPLSGEVTCFPDYTLCHHTGNKIFLELFHTWHASPLLERLKQVQVFHCGKNFQPPLLLAVSKKLMKNPEISEAVETSDYFSQWGLFFREVPTATQITKLLEKLNFKKAPSPQKKEKQQAQLSLNF